ncbi:MAG TPA: hypothetical protein VIG32_04740 [Candidatus Baltobacteraceae bacterium]|jgi:hypothetical protein
MRRNLVPAAIGIFATIMFVAGLFFYRHTDLTKIDQMAKIQQMPSVINVSLTLQYDKPPIYRETYSMKDVNGVSTAQYQIHGFNGKLITITSPPDRNYTVSFFFEKTVQDGIWQIVNTPARGDTSIVYTIKVYQQVNGEHGSRTIAFTDPHYLARQAGHQYAIHLDPQKPTPDLLHLHSTSLADPRYEKLVRDFRTFGPPSFRKKVADAQRMVRAGH